MAFWPTFDSFRGGFSTFLYIRLLFRNLVYRGNPRLEYREGKAAYLQSVQAASSAQHTSLMEHTWRL